MNNRERAALHQRVQSGCVRVAALMLDATSENMAQAAVIAASVVQDIVYLGGKGVAERSLEILGQLRDEGVLAP